MKTKLLIVLAAMTLAACACGQPAPEQPATAAASGDKAYALAVSPGKPAAPVDIRFEALGRPALGVMMGVVVTLVPGSAVERLEAEIVATEGLEGDPQTISTGAQIRGAALQRTILVTPRRAGETFVRVLAETWIGGRKESKVSMFAINVGNLPPPKSGTVQLTPEGERIVTTPAEENSAPR